jgi:hypothetical protein
MTEVIRSTSYDQKEILRNIETLHVPDGFECDLTYGNGSFWTGVDDPKYCYDIDPVESATYGCSTDIKHDNASLSSIIFDPPFLTYIRNGREGNGNMIMSKRFAGYWKYEELQEHYVATLKECSRVLANKGVLVVKCQDIVHNHRLHCTHNMVLEQAGRVGLLSKDLFVLCAKHRLPSPNRKGTQKHARIFHSYFLVLQKRTRRKHE